MKLKRAILRDCEVNNSQSIAVQNGWYTNMCTKSFTDYRAYHCKTVD